jgi:integrase
MATFRKLKGKWLAEVCVQRVRRSKTFYHKHDAQQWALDQEKAKTGALASGKVVGDAFRRYAKEISPKKRGCRWEQVRLKKLARDEITHIAMAQLTRRHVQAWVDRQTISSGSVRREFTLLCAVFKECRVQWGWMSENVTRDVKLPPPPRHRERLASDAEIEALLSVLGYVRGAQPCSTSQYVGLAILLALETAMRHGELWAMRWEDVHLEQAYVRLPMTKNGSARSVPLSRLAVELLSGLERSAERVLPVPQASAGTLFRRAAKKAGVDGLRFHDLRHTAITRLAKKIDVLDLARMVGHKDLKNLMVYYNATATEIAGRLG